MPIQKLPLKEDGLVISITAGSLGNQRTSPGAETGTPKANSWGDYVFDISCFWTLLSFFLPTSNYPQIKETSQHALFQEAHTRFTKQLDVGHVVNQHQSQRALSCLSQAVMVALDVSTDSHRWVEASLPLPGSGFQFTDLQSFSGPEPATMTIVVIAGNY